jgi:hypothetical protein
LVSFFWITWDWPLVAFTQLSPTLIAAQIMTTTILIVLVVYYSFHLYNNNEVDDQSKLLWFVGIIFANAFAMIFYWRKYIW